MIYFDNAATSYPKFQSIYRGIADKARSLGGNPSRSGHFLSSRSSDEVFRCRTALSDFFAGKPENTVFTLNATYALNMAVKGIAKPKDHFIISDFEHNAVLRPIHKLSEEKGCTYSIAKILGKNDIEVINEIENLINSNTKAIVINHASNICSFKIPVRKIGALCEKHGIFFILDASQSAGHEPINIQKDKINILCAPAHKGLYGTMGLGFLITDGKTEISTLTEGGSGYNSGNLFMPEELPEHLEAGTLPVPAISALLSGLEEIKKIGIPKINAHEKDLFSLLRSYLQDIPKIRIYLPEHEGACFLFNIDGITSNSVDEILQQNGICVRSGFHCCPLGHSSLETGEFGAVRVSFGIHNTREEVRRFSDCIRDTVTYKNNLKERRYI